MTPEARHRMNPDLSDLLLNFSLFVELPSCPAVLDYSYRLQLNNILRCCLHLGARTCLLTLNDELKTKCIGWAA